MNLCNSITSPIPRSFLSRIAAAVAITAFAACILTGCDRTGSSVITTSRITPANYDKIHLGMTKAQTEEILGPPSSADKKDFLILKKTTYRYEEGDKFIQITFKNDELDSKDSNLTSPR